MLRAGNDHWGNTFSVLFGGGGMKMGQTIGHSSARGEHVVDCPFDPQDVAETIPHHLGIDVQAVTFLRPPESPNATAGSWPADSRIGWVNRLMLTDLRGAIAGGAAGWCFHNGSQQGNADGQPRRSFDLREQRLMVQLNEEETKFMNGVLAVLKAEQ